METKRQKQVAEIVKRNISLVLQQEGGYIYGAGTLVTVTKVMITPDLNIAKVYLSIYNREDKQSVVLELEENIVRLQQALYQRIRKHVRRTPNIHFFIDDTLDEMYRLNELFNNLDGERQTDNEQEDVENKDS